MDNIVRIVDTLKFANQIVGKPGPIKLNTGIRDHWTMDYSDESGERDTDLLIIGQTGCQITIQDILTALENVSHDEFQDGRSYCFEGFVGGEIVEGEDITYEICWGS